MQLIHTNDTVGYLLYQFDDGELDFLWDEVNQIKKDNFDTTLHHALNYRLAGAIKKQFLLSDKTQESISKFVGNIAAADYGQLDPDYLGEMVRPNMYARTGKTFILGMMDAWVNFQEKYEFNPVHDHSGLYSFVIWLDVPYDMEDEDNSPLMINAEEHNKVSGKFGFLHNRNSRTYTHYLPVDKSWNNRMAFFPSRLQHLVYPFYTSDKYRISVSGNLAILGAKSE
jgi:hypothetical protein